MCIFLSLQAYVFEEIATMDFPFEGIPTVPPRKVQSPAEGSPKHASKLPHVLLPAAHPGRPGVRCR